MLRIHFTPEDLTRVRVAPGPDLLWEISNSVQTLQRKDGERVFGAWRRWARPRLPESRELLSPLLPPYGYSPDFLTPSAGERPTFRAAVDALLGTEPRGCGRSWPGSPGRRGCRGGRPRWHGGTRRR